MSRKSAVVPASKRAIDRLLTQRKHLSVPGSSTVSFATVSCSKRALFGSWFEHWCLCDSSGSSTLCSATVLVRARCVLRQFWFEHVVFCDSSVSSTLCSATVLVRLSRHQKALVGKALKRHLYESAPSCKTALDVITNNRMFVLHVVF